MNKNALAVVGLLAVALALSANAGEPQKHGGFWQKSLLASKEEPKACLYSVGTRPRSYKLMIPTLFFGREPLNKKVGQAYFGILGKDFDAGDETGEILEMCVPPGRYAMTWIQYGMLGGVGLSSTFYDRAFKPVVFDVEEGDYYLGNFAMRQRTMGPFVLYRQVPERDDALIRQYARRPPGGVLKPLALPVVDGPLLRRDNASGSVGAD